MTNSLKFSGFYAVNRRASLVTLLGGTVLALAACGGGGGGSAATGSNAYSSGPITGFGSIILNSNGVRIDDSSASISDDDGNSKSRSDLKLGMMVSVKSTFSSSTSATAQSIVVSGELQGRIAGAPNSTDKTFVVLGQTVKVTGSTVFDSLSLAGGFNALANDTIVEVHGVINPSTNTLSATYIERKNTPSLFKIQGLASAHDAVARKFNIGTTRIDYSGASDVRITPVNGTLVRVRVNAVLPPNAAPTEWTATRIRPPENFNDSFSEAEIEGSITSFASINDFNVNGIRVNTGPATVFRDGTALSVGMRVEVKGSLTAGVLTATRVKIEDGSIDSLEFELHGAMSALNATAKTFTLRGVKVTYSDSTVFRDGGTAANLTDGALVEVKGTGSNALDSSTWINATRIAFE